jgi:hypothetical protein
MDTETSALNSPFAFIGHSSIGGRVRLMFDANVRIAARVSRCSWRPLLDRHRAAASEKVHLLDENISVSSEEVYLFQ